MQISVIIPTYRPEAYLFECLDSLRSQTLPVTQWEGIIVLNGCDEPWRTQINTYLKQHKVSHIRLIQTDTPGVSNARNMGIEAAQGEYIAFIDDDDYVSNTYLEQLLKIATPDTIGASYTRAFSDTQNYIPYYIEREYMRFANKGAMPFYKVKRYFGGPCMKLIHRNIIGDTRFDTRFSNGEDSLFMFEISKHVRQVQFTDKDAVYYRRLRTGSASLSQQRSKALVNRFRLMHAYHCIYWRQPKAYRFEFYITRLIASLHAILAGK